MNKADSIMNKADSIMETRQDKQGQIKRIKDRIRTNKLLLELNTKEIIKANAPAGYKSGSSYNDYDTIHGSKKIIYLDDFYEEQERLKTQIDLDEKILLRLEKEPETDEYLNLLTTDKEKIEFLRKVKGFTQKQTAEKLFISERKVRMIENGK